MKKEHFYLPLIVILAVLFLWQWQCNKPEKPQPEIREVVKLVEIPVKGDTVIIRPNPERVTLPGKERIIWRDVVVNNGRVDTVIRVPKDTAAVSDYYTSREYWDTTRTPYGPIITNNVVSENKLQLSQTLYDFKIPEKTIERTIYQKSGALFGGIRGMGSRDNLLSGYNVNLAYKTKGDKIFEVGAWKLQGTNGLHYEAGVKIKLIGK